MRSFSLYISVLLMVLAFHCEDAFSQRHLNEGNKYFDRNMFEESIPFYLKEIQTGKVKYKNEAREKLANSYRLTGRFLEATEIYKVILDKGSKNNKAENYLNYATSLKNAAKYEEAADMFKKYIELAPNDPMGSVYLESCFTAQNWLDAESRYFVKNEELVNTPGSEYSTAWYNDGIVFSSARPDSKKKFINIEDDISVMRSDMYYLDLIKSKDGVASIENFSGLNSPYHDGTPTFSADGKEVYFARTITGTKDKKTNVVLNSLQIYYSKQDPFGVWSKPVSAFSFNSDNYSVAQASLSRDGTRIYFASDMPGGYGSTDIYYSELNDKKEWGKPVNLGAKINTFGHELFPYIHGSDTLYFSSETHPGMGKLDIFQSLRVDGKWKPVTNMGTPINSIGDDFGIVFDNSQTLGFFTSDRFNGKGKEDLYTFYRIGHQNFYFHGNKIMVPDHSLYNGITYRIAEEGAADPVTLESEDGYYSHPLKEGVNYTLTLRREGFFYDAIRVRLYRELGDTCLLADIQSRNSSFVVGGVMSEGKMKVTTETRLKEGSKKEFEEITDTVIIESPLAEIPVSISRTDKVFNITSTNKKGFYVFPDTLKSGKAYTVLAVKPEKPQPVDDPEKPLADPTAEKDEPKADSLVNKPEELVVDADSITALPAITQNANPLVQKSDTLNQNLITQVVNNTQATSSSYTVVDSVIRINTTTYIQQNDTVKIAAANQNIVQTITKTSSDTLFVAQNPKLIIPTVKDSIVNQQKPKTAIPLVQGNTASVQAQVLQPVDSIPKAIQTAPPATQANASSPQALQTITPVVQGAASTVPNPQQVATAEHVNANAVQNAQQYTPVSQGNPVVAQNTLPVQENVVATQNPPITNPVVPVTSVPVPNNQQLENPLAGNSYKFTGTILNATENKALEGCEIKLFNGENFVEKVVSDSKGAVNLNLTSGETYSLYVAKEGYFQSQIAIGGESQTSGPQSLKILMNPIVYNKTIPLKNILFDFNKYGLRKESMSELNRLVDFLSVNPNTSIELNAHTDTRGDYYPNLLLSYRRAEATREYLISRGIEDYRIFANGFGETFPSVKAAKTEADHEKNRRVEFRVIKSDGPQYSQTGFSVLATNAYSAEHPIPEIESLPEGLAYRIRLGSYKKQVPFDTFKGVFPVVQVWDEQKEVYNYYAGLFSSKEAADNALRIAKINVAQDVFVQAYFNSDPITHETARTLSPSNPSQESNETVNTMAIDRGLPGFSIQIGAFRKNVKPANNAQFRKMAANYGLYINKYNNDYTIYSIGDFLSYAEAFEAKQKLVANGLTSESFIIALLNGKKIPVNEAIGIIERYEAGRK